MTALIVIDVAIVVLLLGLFLRSGRNKKEMLSQRDLIQIKGLESTLRRNMSESARASAELFKAFDERMKNFEDLLNKVEVKERMLRKAIHRSVKLIESMELKPVPDSAASAGDPYGKAVEMIAQGLPSEAIERASGLNSGEIDLIRNIARHRTG